MTLEEAKVLARQGVKVTHRYFMDDEFITMRGDMIIFDGNEDLQMSFYEYTRDKEYLNDGWSKFEE